MTTIPDSLTDESLDRTIALGRELEIFLRRRNEVKALDPDAEVAPHPELLQLIAAAKAKYTRVSGQAAQHDADG